ncbi:fibrinogen-like YCDxxxxGGGW domain-containing protein [Polyangium aurulentum]|uniref:fibrinogen-like YCDxxxxGGGW domain-containing protein n=1 Tax=Polyangium aurulentum TaxID=2567896 RepID=UPI0010AEC499|nr:fibrinogen-like YCDxxxxGGGW domain-containing protein [Polyangium aurulentum]UQA58971.1 hypothetical protein E8A73_000150 [Polyangium aurulentum]
MRTNHRLLEWVGVCLLGGVAVVSCGGGNDTTTTSTGGHSTTASGGVGGEGGAGGAAGMGGAGGAAGMGGAGGAAGMGGAGGAAGMGGAGGAAGMGGAGGAAGMGGAGGGGGQGGVIVCAPGDTQPCYEGPAGTEGIGMCQAGTQTCNAEGTGYGACEGQVLPATESCDAPGDDDCDGQTNEDGAGCLCVPGSVKDCYSGPPETQDKGPCKGGTQTCNADGLGHGPCVGEVTPAAETCDTAEDDDCDGQTNEEGAGCACIPDSVAPCYEGPAGTEGVGACVGGTKTCNAQGTAYGACSGQVLPAAEACTTLADEDCDGQTNEEGAGCVCLPNSSESCYGGPAGTAGVGVCHGGVRTCSADGTSWGPCAGEVLPSAETCNTAEDDDCNGQTNEAGAGCVCPPSSTASCYGGPAGTAGVGPCAAGTMTCNAQGTAYGPCVGEVLPQAETCNTAEDDDCNGQTNEGGAGCVCLPNSTESCYGGPAGTAGVGVCKAGTRTCNAQGTAYGACAGEVLPQTEACAGTSDENCNGLVNDGCTYKSCLEIKQNNPAAGSGTYTIDTDGAGPKPPVQVQCDMTTDGGGYTMVRFNDAALTTDQNAYANKCAQYGMEIIVPRTKAHATSIYTWNGNEVPNLYNVFPKSNGATGIFNWQGICKGAPCSFWMTDNANGDVACGGFEPNGDNNTAFRIYKWNTGCGVQGGWNDANNSVYYPGWVVCSTNDK